MAWDPDKKPGPSRLKTTAHHDDPLSLGPPCPVPAAIQANPTDVHDPEDNFNSTVPFLLSYKGFQCCTAEGHKIPSNPIEAYMIASETNIRHCVCPVCAPFIASQVVHYYAQQHYRILGTRCEQNFSQALLAARRGAKLTVRKAKVDVRMRQVNFLRHSDLQTTGPSMDTGTQDQLQKKSVRWEKFAREYDGWPELEEDEEEEEPIGKGESFHLLPVNPSPSSATIAAALLVAALTFAAAEPSEHRYPKRVPGYESICWCRHDLPADPSIPCTDFDGMVMGYGPPTHLCMPCTRLMSAKRAYFAAKQAHYDLLSHGGDALDEGKGMESLLVTLKQAEQLVEWREEAREAMINSDAPGNHVICDIVEKNLAYDNSVYAQDFEEWQDRLKIHSMPPSLAPPPHHDSYNITAENLLALGTIAPGVSSLDLSFHCVVVHAGGVYTFNESIHHVVEWVMLLSDGM
ncbi:hypothetical protein BFW01_g10857 [Lasiodiplodia theobromae]|uniref:Uncharacterized protein n=1 Tax=Lasiodiplodia theobromae TaxID=45133 RepID=A0A8H7IPK1_9PEZI|nr:hypothetical protein BFW01_g10857 [Lasiodiplodia theobromae]